MIRENGTTRLNVVSRASGPADPFLQAVQEAAAGDFTVLGEIGRGANGVIIYLARETSSKRLVALKLQREGQLADEYGLELVRHLDNSMPAPDSKCFKCGESVGGWARYCGHCGADLSGSTPPSDDAVDRALMLQAVREAVTGQYEVLGEMARNEGGGAVYFAKDVSTGKIVALRLQREGAGEEFSLGLTTALKPIARSLGVRSGATQALSALRPTPPTEAAKPRGNAGTTPPPPSRAPSAPPPPPPTRGRNPALRLIVPGIAAVALIAAIVIFTLPRSGGQLQAPPVDSMPAIASVDTAPARDSAAPVAAATVATDSAKTSAPARTATVRLTGLPANAVITVDGQRRTGTSLAIPSGAHRIAFSAPGYADRSESLSLRAGETVNWTPTLTKVAATATPAPPKPQPTPTATASACATEVKSENWKPAFTACMSEALDGSTIAKRNLGMLYARGRGVAKSERSSASYYEAAANDGDRLSMVRIAEDYEQGDGVDKNEATALAWYTKAANGGVLEAQSKLGDVYERGRLGVKKDKAAALEWYQKAAAQGDKAAAKKVKDLSK